MKKDLSFAIIGILIVLSPLVILALHYHNTVEKFIMQETKKELHELARLTPKMEHFIASQGGVLQQLASSRVSSEQEVNKNLENEKRQVVNDILYMTEPESFPGPRPASH
jgi:hypothetical protein